MVLLLIDILGLTLLLLTAYVGTTYDGNMTNIMTIKTWTNFYRPLLDCLAAKLQPPGEMPWSFGIMFVATAAEVVSIACTDQIPG